MFSTIGIKALTQPLELVVDIIWDCLESLEKVQPVGWLTQARRIHYVPGLLLRRLHVIERYCMF